MWKTVITAHRCSKPIYRRTALNRPKILFRLQVSCQPSHTGERSSFMSVTCRLPITTPSSILSSPASSSSSSSMRGWTASSRWSVPAPPGVGGGGGKGKVKQFATFLLMNGADISLIFFADVSELEVQKNLPSISYWALVTMQVTGHYWYEGEMGQHK